MGMSKGGTPISRMSLNKNVGIVEETEKQETEKIEGALTLDSGGVFWINAVENECRQCEGFEIPKKTVRADTCWRKRPAIEGDPVPVSNSMAVCNPVKRNSKNVAERWIIS